MKLLILPCSSKKCPGGANVQANNCFLDYLNLNDKRVDRNIYYQNLLNQRNYIPDVVKRNYYLNTNQYKRAIDRYNGELYDGGLRDLLIDKITDKKLDVLIISGLYGLLKYDDEIVDYHLEITKGGIVGSWFVEGISIIEESIYMYANQNIILERDITCLLSPNSYGRSVPVLIGRNLWQVRPGAMAALLHNRQILINFLNQL